MNKFGFSTDELELKMPVLLRLRYKIPIPTLFSFLNIFLPTNKNKLNTPHFISEILHI
jgi:hypothetical protein